MYVRLQSSGIGALMPPLGDILGLCRWLQAVGMLYKMNGHQDMELESTNGRVVGLNTDEDGFLILKPAGIIGGFSRH